MLPERFSALWHSDTNSLEFIWTAWPLSQSQQDVRDRRFNFIFDEKNYNCEFGLSSERLIVLAEHYEQISSPLADYRNLISFEVHAMERQQVKDGRRNLEEHPYIGEPLSFWIKEFKWDEDEALELASYINFYMSYYDTLSPLILIHSPEGEAKSVKPQTRYIAGSFPRQIKQRPIDDTLIHFWSASQQGDPARRFIYCFRIVEFAAFSFLDQTTRLAVRKILSAPNALDAIQVTTEQVVATIQAYKVQADQRIDAVLKETVDPILLWREIEQNLAFFSSDITFDGGFELSRMVSEKATKEEFEVNGITVFSNSIKQIRNALSHGRDLRTTGVITPTTQNFERLRPWVSLMSVAAGEVILFKGL